MVLFIVRSVASRGAPPAERFFSSLLFLLITLVALLLLTLMAIVSFNCAKGAFLPAPDPPEAQDESASRTRDTFVVAHLRRKKKEHFAYRRASPFDLQMRAINAGRQN